MFIEQLKHGLATCNYSKTKLFCLPTGLRLNLDNTEILQFLIRTSNSLRDFMCTVMRRIISQNHFLSKTINLFDNLQKSVLPH